MQEYLMSFLNFEKLQNIQSFREYICHVDSLFRQNIHRSFVDILNNELSENNVNWYRLNKAGVHNIFFSFPIYFETYRCIIYDLDESSNYREASLMGDSGNFYLTIRKFSKYNLRFSEKISNLLKGIDYNFGFYNILEALMWDYKRAYNMYTSIIDSFNDCKNY